VSPRAQLVYLGRSSTAQSGRGTSHGHHNAVELKSGMLSNQPPPKLMMPPTKQVSGKIILDLVQILL